MQRSEGGRRQVGDLIVDSSSVKKCWSLIESDGCEDLRKANDTNVCDNGVGI